MNLLRRIFITSMLLAPALAGCCDEACGGEDQICPKSTCRNAAKEICNCVGTCYVERSDLTCAGNMCAEGSPDNVDDYHKLTPGILAAIIIGFVLLACGIVVCSYFCCCRTTKKRDVMMMNQEANTPAQNVAYIPPQAAGPPSAIPVGASVEALPVAQNSAHAVPTGVPI